MNQPYSSQLGRTGIQQEAVQLLQWLQQQGYQFATISPHSHAAYLARRQQSGYQYACHLRDIFGWSLPFQPDLLPQPIFALLQQAEWLEEYPSDLDSLLWRSKIRVASLENLLFIHSPYPTTDEHAVFFGPDTYRFIYALKQHLIQQNVEQLPIQRALELCSGAAPAALTIAHYYPQAEVVATDINAQALEFASINASFNQAPLLNVMYSNMFGELDGEFDLITANPPYLVDREQRLYRHGGSMLGAELAFNIVKQSLAYLSINGCLLLYSGIVIVNGQDEFRRQVQQHLQSFGLQYRMTYSEMDSDIFAEELELEFYPDAERIAAVIVVIQRMS